MFAPYDRTATERRKLRNDIRNRLGVSHQPAPEAERLLSVAAQLSELVSLSTSGRVKLKVSIDGLDMAPVFAIARAQASNRGKGN